MATKRWSRREEQRPSQIPDITGHQGRSHPPFDSPVPGRRSRGRYAPPPCTGIYDRISRRRWPGSESDADERRAIQVRLDRLLTQETRIVRDLADQNKLDLLDRTLNEITDERQTLQSRLDEIDENQRTAHVSESQLRTLAEQAQTRLDNPNPELMAQVFDLLDIQLHRVEQNRFEGTGTIPIPDDDDEQGDSILVSSRGEVSSKVPQPLYSNLAGLEFHLEVTV